MGWKTFFSFIFFLFAITLLLFYLILPFDSVEFGTGFDNSEFIPNSDNTSDMQFYPRMRYVDSKISYKIIDCPLQKKDDMLRAFEIVENQTVLDFYPVNSKEEISVICDSRNKIEEGLFIAGEGGPTNITQTSNFNVILKGDILLIRSSECEKPNIAIHELFHTLGFGHSLNPNNIMYNVSRCKQTIGAGIVNLIEDLYSTPNYPDLSFENISAHMKGRYLNTEISIRNNGLKESHSAKILIYADGKLVKEINLEPLGVGYGKIIGLKNILITKLSVDEFKFVIKYDFEEINENNNIATLVTKN